MLYIVCKTKTKKKQKKRNCDVLPSGGLFTSSGTELTLSSPTSEQAFKKKGGEPFNWLTSSG